MLAGEGLGRRTLHSSVRSLLLVTKTSVLRLVCFRVKPTRKSMQVFLSLQCRAEAKYLSAVCAVFFSSANIWLIWLSKQSDVLQDSIRLELGSVRLDKAVWSSRQWTLEGMSRGSLPNTDEVGSAFWFGVTTVAVFRCLRVRDGDIILLGLGADLVKGRSYHKQARCSVTKEMQKQSSNCNCGWRCQLCNTNDK